MIDINKLWHGIIGKTPIYEGYDLSDPESVVAGMIGKCGTAYIPVLPMMIDAVFASHKAVPTTETADEQEGARLLDERDEVYDAVFTKLTQNVSTAAERQFFREASHFYDIAGHRLETAIKINPALLSLAQLPTWLAERISREPMIENGRSFPQEFVEVLANVGQVLNSQGS
jgi:hypothetical protein